MARWLQIVADALPLTYSFDALSRVGSGGPYSGWFTVDVAVTLGAIVVSLVLAAATLRRRTP
jgi:ABC-2 type transport system permease protein